MMTTGRFSVLFIAAAALQTAAWALQVTPSRTEIRLTPGESREGKLEVHNELTTPVSVELDTKDWFVLPENKNVGVDDWLTVDETPFELGPGQTREVSYKVRPPKGGAVGALVGMVSFLPRGETDDGTINLIMSVSIYLTIQGTERAEGSLKEFALRMEGDALRVGVSVENKGNVHLRPSGTVDIYDLKGQKKGTITIPETRPVYPGQSRAYFGSMEWPKGDKSVYRAVARIAAGDGKTLTVEKKFRIKKDKVEMVTP